MGLAALVATSTWAAIGCGGDDGSGPGMDGGGGAGALGDPCTLTRDCTPDLYCSDARTCAASGDAGDGEACTTTADCLRGLVCQREPAGRVCRTAGDRDIGDSCLRDDQCLAGLRCVGGTCSGEAPDAGPGGFDGGHVACTPSGGECDDGSNCTSDMCIADTCVHTLIDSDEDGYASTRIIGGCGRDCADMDPDANPDHTAFMTAPHAGGPGQISTFDWNCDGTEEPEHDQAVVCAAPTCGSGEGWLDPVPACGDTARWGRCTTGCTEEVLEPARTQACR